MRMRLAIVGRPNVGKSTLFNRLVGKRLALVDNQPGVTRDLREGDAQFGDLRFVVVDTAGFEDVTDDNLRGRMRRLTERAVDEADAALMLIDARTGVTPLDEVFADFLRRRSTPVFLGANKAESSVSDHGVFEAYKLGLGDPIRLSAEHGEGMSDLYAALRPLVDSFGVQVDENLPDMDVPIDNELEAHELHFRNITKPVQIAVVGRPNVGKSTLINQITGTDQLLTGPEAGITRDAIARHIHWKGDDGQVTPMRIFDTAGMRKKAKVQEKLEKLSVRDGLRAVKYSEVVIVLLDATIPFKQQDLKIIDLIEREGRAIVVALNKWDIVRNRQARFREMREAFERRLSQVKGADLVAVSARTGLGVVSLRSAVLASFETWNRRIPTAELNRWIIDMIEAHPPPAPRGTRIKLRYMTQVKTRPPSFVVMCSRPDKMPASYSRYLVNGLRTDFELFGTPIRLSLRSQREKNPYKDCTNRRQPSQLRKHLKSDAE
ncbi:MAG: ribosome biogenesis GTPase Der [Aestuariivita sp.]|nr:ribosome biogenesis GTPase Der [Aestuariivita sp.]